MGTCVNIDWDDPTTEEVVFCPTDSVGTKLFGSLLVAVTGEHRPEPPEKSGPEVIEKVNVAIIC